jgi:protein transport protein SEC23
LLLDSYFNVIEWYGEHVQNWNEEKYHENPDYPHITDLFDSPTQDINYIMATRFPVPNFYKVYPNHSKERYLKSRVNPKKSA